MIFLAATDFTNVNIGDVVITTVGGLVTWLLNRVIQDNKDEIARMNKHIENTDTVLQKMKEDHNEHKLDVIEKMNEIEKGIIGKINELSIKVEQSWRGK